MAVPLASVLAGTRLRVAATGTATTIGGTFTGYGLGSLFGDSDLPIVGQLGTASTLLVLAIGAIVVMQLFDSMPSGGN